MDEQRLERTLRAGPPFATRYVARPLVLDGQSGLLRGIVPRLVLLLAILALLLAASIFGALLGGWLRVDAAAAIVRGDCPSSEPCPRTVKVIYADGRERTILSPTEIGSAEIDDLALSLDGMQVAFNVAASNAEDSLAEGVYVMRSDGGSLRRLRQPSAARGLGEYPCNEDGAYLRWAPDGRAILGCFVQEAGTDFRTVLVVIDVASGETTVLDRASDHLGELFGPYHWSPNGDWVAYRTQREGNALSIVRRDGSDRRQLVIGDGPMSLNALTVPSDFAWSPRSDAIAYGDYPAEASVIHIVGLDGTESEISLPPQRYSSTVEVIGWNDNSGIIYRSADGSLIGTTSVDGTDGGLLLDYRGITPQWLIAEQGSRLNWPAYPWVSSDGRTVEWWEPRASGTCLMTLEDGHTANTQLCVAPAAFPRAAGQ